MLKNAKNSDCNDVIISKDMKRLYRTDCAGQFPVICKKYPVISLNTTTTTTNQATESVLIGLSAAISVFFVIALLLLAYVCYKNKSGANKDDDKIKTDVAQNLPDQIDPGYQSIDEIKNGEVTYMEIKEGGNGDKENEKETIQFSRSKAVYTQIKKKTADMINSGSFSDIYTIVDKTTNNQKIDNIV